MNCYFFVNLQNPENYFTKNFHTTEISKWWKCYHDASQFLSITLEKNFLCVQRCTWCFILCKSKENFEIIKTIFLKLARTFKQLNDECEEYLLNVRIINRNKDNSNIPNDSKALFCKRFLLRDKVFMLSKT